MTTPITPRAVPLGPELRPGTGEPTGTEAFAALLGQLATVVAGAPHAPRSTTGRAEEPGARAVAGPVALSCAPLLLPTPTAPLPTAPDLLTPMASLPTAPDLLPTAPAGTLPAGPAPVAVPPGSRPDPTLATTAPVPTAAGHAGRAAHGPWQATAGPVALPGEVQPAPRPEGEVPAVPAPGQGTSHAVPPPLPSAAAQQGVDRTEGVRPALVDAARGLRQEGHGRVSLVVRLNPPELGSVLVKLTVQDGRVDVQLRTPDLQAVGDLTAQSREVEQVLKEAGFDLSSFDVSHGAVRDGRGERETPDRGTTHRQHGADGRPEAPPVTDDAPDARPAGTWL